MTAPQPAEDGALPLALRELADAIHALCGPQSRMVDNKLVQIPSRYLQLRDATEGEQANAGGGGGSKSRPPFWTDAFDCLNEIDTSVEAWQPAFNGVPPTVGRLRTLQARGWRPQDVRQLQQITAAVLAWAADIDALLDPPRRWTLPSPCPACNTAVVYRRDTGGELIRQPALQIGPSGCFCAKCRATWSPDRFVWLAKLLGYEMPAGVLE